MQRSVRVNLEDGILEASIAKIIKGPEESGKYQTVQIETSRGRIDCHYYEVKRTEKGVVLVGGIGGGFDTPAKGLYPRLAENLKDSGISSMRVRYRHPADMAESILDTVISIDFLKSQGIKSIGLIGHSFGGAVVIQAAANDQAVRAIVTLSTQSFGTAAVSQLKNGTSILLIHGRKDKILPPSSSAYVYKLAHEPKKLAIYEGAGHSLNEVEDKIYEEVKNWIIANLR